MHMRPISLLFASAVLFAMLAPAARADTLNFSFSFTGTNYSINGEPMGTVSGEIFGLADNGTSSATAIYIDTADNNKGDDTLPYNVLSAYATVVANSFTVSNGVIVADDVYIKTQDDPNELDFSALTLNYSGTNGLSFDYGPINNFYGLAGTTFEPLTASATPEPAAITYMLESFGVGACLAWRRLRGRRRPR